MKSMNYYLLRREWLQYRSFGKSWLLVWAIYLGLYLLMGISASFVITFLPIIMTYSAVYTVKQAGEAVGAGTEDFLLPVPLRQVLWARYQFAFLVGLASSVVVVCAILLRQLLNPAEKLNLLFTIGSAIAYSAVITGGSMPLLYKFGATRGRFTLLVLMGLAAALGGSAAIVGMSAIGGMPNSAGYGIAACAALLWALMPFSLRLTERFYRQGGVDHERHPIVEG